MKNKKVLVFTILFIAILFSGSIFLQHAGIAQGDYKKDTFSAHVIDGDTIELSNGEMVRYIGIDTPEVRERKGSEWIYNPRPYAEAAKDFNTKLVEGRAIRLEFDVQKKDRYNRLLAYVYAGDKMVNLEMLKEGYAMPYTYPPNVKYVEEFLSAKEEARINRKGLWSDLEKNVIPASLAKNNIGLVRIVETKVIDTYLSERVLILNCKDNFKVAIFKNNLAYFPKIISRSPDTYFRGKSIRVYGIIKDYKGSPEIVLYDSSQLEIIG